MAARNVDASCSYDAPAFAFAYIGCIACFVMLALGCSPGEIDKGWHDMAGWKRGLLSLVLVGATISLLTVVGGLVVDMAR